MKDQMERLIEQMVDSGVFFKDAVAEFEKGYLRKVLEINRDNQSEAAKTLGIHRNTFGRKMEEYKLNGRSVSRAAKVGQRKSAKPLRRTK
jgi:DNA-binding NtrC family response regulator